MSLISFLAKIWIGIKSMFAKLPKELKAAIHIGVIVVENIKTVIDSPLADVLTAIIPGQLDDRAKDILRAELPAILIKLRLVDEAWQAESENAVLLNAMHNLSQLAPDAQKAFFHNISILIAQMASDGKLTWSDGVYLQEWYYNTQFKPAK
jgi:hypothetical protein